MITNVNRLFTIAMLPIGLLSTASAGLGQSISHQISLPAGQSWCSDSMINGVFSQINALRVQQGRSTLRMDTLGMKDAEIRAGQFITYMNTHNVGVGFNPHEGYDTTAASLGYPIISENLAYSISDPASLVATWSSDSLHLGAMLASDANVAGVSCVYSGGIPFWTFEPGNCPGGSCGSPIVTPTANSPLDTEEWAFLTLINNFRAQNGSGPLQVSVTLEASSRWMSNDLAAKNYFSHTDSLGRSSGARIQAFGYTYYPWGENIAAGNSNAQNTFNQWLNACDPDGSGQCTYAHKVNMLNGSFKVIGIARAYGPSATYGWYWTTDFGGVVDQVITPGGASKPTISSFTANPASITTGQSSSLTWNVSGASSVTISSIGDVTGLSSKAVAPSATTSYTLTATNAAGNSTATVTVTVSAPAGDSQPPSTPTITSINAPGSTQVSLNWSASTDNVGVTGYQIYRNGGLLNSVSGSTLSYSDTSVTSGTNYSYYVKARDAAGNVSPQSNAANVTTPAVITGSPCPGPVFNAFTGCYYNNTGLSGNPMLTRTDASIAFNWGAMSPGASIPGGNFSARWQGTFSFGAGDTTFTVTASDGVRLYIDGALVLDRWVDQFSASYTVRRNLTQGNHTIQLDYYEHTGAGMAVLVWGAPVAAAAPVISSFTASPTSVVPGQSALLAWNVSGATSVSIAGVGDVTGLSSKVVTPNQTTTYVLTATNGNGSTTSQVTVNVSAPSGDSQPPSTPTLTTAYAASLTQVILGWSASTDNVGVTGYQIIRNGSVLANVAGNQLSFSDTSVTYNTSYSYQVRAFDAKGNFSGLSNIGYVLTPAPYRGGR